MAAAAGAHFGPRRDPLQALRATAVNYQDDAR
jgi:hypothetical protein